MKIAEYLCIGSKESSEKKEPAGGGGSSSSNAEAKQAPVVRKCEVDKFGFYHAQPVQAPAAASAASSSTSSHDGKMISILKESQI